METLQNQTLRVTVQPDEVSARIELLNTDLVWNFQPNVEGDVWVTHGQTQVAAYLREASQKSIRRVSIPDEDRLTLFLRGLPGNTGLAISFALPKREPTLRVEVESLSTGTPSRVREVRFPGAIAWETSQPQHTLWPNAAGMILPNSYDHAISPNGEGLGGRMGFNRSLYQPWWGVVGDRGAYAAIAETPFDFALDIRHPAGGTTVTRPVWFPSMGHLAYPRAIRYVFFEHGDHTTLAKAYRAYSKSIGRWVSLEEKFDRNPQVQRLVGSVIFPISICSHNCRVTPPTHSVTTFAQRADQVLNLKRELGREKVYLHVDGWGYRGYDNQHPDIFPPCPDAGGWEGLIQLSKTAAECGYLFGLHDQYRDYYLDGPQFTESRAIKNADGSLPQWSTWAGGPQTVLCAKESLGNIRRNFTELLGRGVILTASYLDVFAIVPMDECYDPAHPMTREDCFRWRAAGIDYVRKLGLVISSEEPVDCFIPNLDFAHWADYPRAAFMKGEYLGIPVPLHTLVYHDALLLPAVFDYGGSPENRPRHFLEALGRVEIPYGRISWQNREDFRNVDMLAKLHEAWGTAELVSHRLLDSDGMIQEFEYPEGKISIDLNALRYRIEGGPLETDDWAQVDV